MHRGGIRSQTADTSSRLKTSGTDTIALGEALQEIMVSFVEQGGEKVNDDHEEDSHKLCIIQ